MTKAEILELCKGQAIALWGRGKHTFFQKMRNILAHAVFITLGSLETGGAFGKDQNRVLRQVVKGRGRFFIYAGKVPVS